MKITNIHEAWGSVIEFDDPLEFFSYSKGYWRDMIYKRKLLIFKKMKFQLLDYAKFAHHFGRPWRYDEYHNSKEEPVEITEGDSKYAVTSFFSGLHNSNNQIDIRRDMDLHADIPNHKTHPFPFRALWIVKKPQNNSGSTYWLNIEDCFDKLNPELKALTKDINLVQQSWHRYNTEKRFLNFIKKHPVTGKESLRLNFYATPEVKNAWIIKVFIKLVEQKDCSLIQQYIDDLMQYEELYHQHVWDLYDVAIYDNYSFVHGRTPVEFKNDEENNERKFYRINIDHMTNDEFQNVELPPSTATSTIK